MRGAVVMPDGEIILPLNDVPDFCRIFVVCSHDQGRTWERPALACFESGRLHTEPALLLLPRGRLLLMTREDDRRIMRACASDDGGRTWSVPTSTGIHGYPSHLLVLADGRVLCTYGMRQPEFSIRASISDDGGESWGREIRIRGTLPTRDLGYPATIGDDDGSLFTVYYCQYGNGVTGIEGTCWELPC